MSNAKPPDNPPNTTDPERIEPSRIAIASPITLHPDFQDPGPHDAAQRQAGQGEAQDRQPSPPIAALTPDQPAAPLTLSPLHPDFDLLLDFLSPSLSIGALCSRHGLAPHELAAWLATPIVQQSIETMKHLIAARQPLIDLQIPQAVKATHPAIVGKPPPEDPRLAAHHAETARKSASALSRLLARDTKPSLQPAPGKPDRTQAPTSLGTPTLLAGVSTPSTDPHSGGAPPPCAGEVSARLCEADSGCVQFRKARYLHDFDTAPSPLTSSAGT